MNLFGRRSSWWGPPASLPPSRHVLAPGDHPVAHALQDFDERLAQNWQHELGDYLSLLTTISGTSPGDPNAEARLRAAQAFVIRAHGQLAGVRCSCALAAWAHRDTVALHAEAVRLLGATAAVVYAPRWSPLL